MKRKLLLFLCLAIQIAIYADPVEIALTDGAYTGSFTQGQSYTIAGHESFADWYVDPDFFTVTINNNLVFRATGGVYRVTADEASHSLLALKIWDDSDSPAQDGSYWQYTEEYNPDNKEGAIWVTGADGSIGLPKYTSGDDWNHVYCVPKVAENIFEITLTVGKELNAEQVNFKFRGTPNSWDKDFKGSVEPSDDTYKISSTSDVFGVGTSADDHGDGNIYLKEGKTLTVGDTYKFRLDCTNAHDIVLTVQNITIPVSPTPTHNAGQVFSVFSDSYVDKVGEQSVKYKQDNTNWQAVAKKSFSGNPSNSYLEMELNNGWVIVKNAQVADVSKYDYMHIDIYRQYMGPGADFNTFYAYPRSQQDKPEDADAEGFTAFARQKVTVVEGQWESFDIPLYDKNSTYKDYMQEMEQLLITGAGKGILAVDNVYFWRELVDATLTTEHGTTVYQYASLPLKAVFTDKSGDEFTAGELSSLTYTVTGVGSVDGNGVFSSTEAGEATITVEGTYGGVTKQATLTLTVLTIPESPDPTRHGADVVSVYSNSYLKHLHFLDGNFWTDAGSVTQHVFDADSNNKFAIFDQFKYYVTVELGGALNVEGYDHLHFDVFQLTGDENKTIYAFPRHADSEPADTRDDNTTLACAKGEWRSIDIDLTKEPFSLLNDYAQIVFISENGAPTHESFAIDNVYFWREQPADPVTTDTDKKGINWDSTTGATCYVDKVIWEKMNNEPMSGLDGFAKAHDGNNLTYHTITKEELNNNEHAQFLIQLTKPINVSDVELVWANGFPQTYNVYAFAEFPLVNSAIPEVLLTDANKLFGFKNHLLPTDPYIETVSNLQDKGPSQAQYILIDMLDRGEKTTFGYYLSEIHVGAFDDNYNMPDHLGVPDYTIVTEEDKTLEVTVRNKRNAILPDAELNLSSVRTSWTSPQLKKRNNQETIVYATSSGEYAVTINGELSDGTQLNPGTALITVNKNWRVGGQLQSIVQKVYNSAGSEEKLKQLFRASRSETGYTPWKVGDGKEVADDVESRWSSFDNTDGEGSIPWDGSEAAANRRKNWNKNQYLLIDLEKVYEVTNVEIIWERAYAPEYTVYGFEEGNLPTEEQLLQDYETFKTTYSEDHLLYSCTNTEAGIASYPLHDEHSNLSTTGAITEDNRTRYMLIKMNEPAMQNGDYFGFSIWELYAWGADLTVTDNVADLSADNISVKAGHEGSVTVKAYGGTYDAGSDTYEYEEDNWHPVVFSTKEEGYFIKKVEQPDPETSTTLERFFLYRGTDEEQDAIDANLVAIITDNNNGTYAIVASKHGYGQTPEHYDDGLTSGSGDISFTIDMTSTSTKGGEIKGRFELVVYKNVMALLTDGTSTDKNQVYDDGYFSLEVLKANASRESNTIDLRNVDFTFSNAGDPLSNVSIPSPHTVKSDAGTQMNPNTIYYTNETGLVGEGNLAVKQSTGEWRVAALRIFDGWDWAPLTGEGGMVANQAWFYTSLKADNYSFIAMPFVPTFASFSDKQVKLYKPQAYSPTLQVVQVDEMTADDFVSGFEGQPYVIRTSNTGLYKPNGYGVVFKSSGETSVVYGPKTWTDAKTGAAITSSYVKKDLTDSADSEHDLYLFSSAYEMFLPVGNEKLTDDYYNSEEVKLSKTHVMPFYAYLSLPKALQSATPASHVTFFLGQLPTEDLTPTGIADLQQTDDFILYDIQGRYVGRKLTDALPAGVYVVKYGNGTTRKISIRK